METNVVLKIYDSSNSLDFEIPLSSGKNTPLSLDKRLSDIADLTKRAGVQSISFKFPISKDIATNYDYLNQSQHHNYKDVDDDKLASLVIDGIERERGKFRVLTYVNKDGFEELEGLFYGNNLDWVEAGKSKKLSDLTWDTNSITYNTQTIKSSFTNTVDNGDEWVFPLENRGGRKMSNVVHTEDFRPSLFMHSVITKFFKSIGYTFTSDFFTSTAYKTAVLSFFGKNFRNKQSVIDANKVYVGNQGTATSGNATQNTNLYYNKPLNIGNQTNFAWTENSPFYDVGSNYNPVGGSLYFPNSAGLFTAPQTGYYKFKLKIKGQYGNLNAYPTVAAAFLRHTAYLLKKDVGGNPVQNQTGYSMANAFIGSVTGAESPTNTRNYSWDGVIEIYLKTGESAEVWNLLHGYNDQYGDTTFLNWNFSVSSAFLNIELLPKIAEHHTFNLSDVVDDSYNIVDILNDESRKFNLFWDADPVLKTVKVEPRDDFYSSIATAKDYTDKIDISKQIKTVYNSSLHKSEMVFSYNDDSADKFVEERDKELGTNLAEYKHSLPSKFKEGTTRISTSVQAASYIIKDVYSLEPSLSDYAPYTVRYWDEFSESIPENMLEDHAPRVLNYSYKLQNAVTVLDTDGYRFRFYDETGDRRIIPALLPHQVKVNGTLVASANINMYWHSVNDQDGLFSYWAKTVTEIINGKKVTAYFLITPKTWQDFKFKDLIYLDEPIDLKGYYVVESLENYQPENSNVLKMELLKRINYDASVEGSTSFEAEPIGGGNPSPINAAPMTVNVLDANSNEINVNMQSMNEQGNSTILI